MSEMASVMSQIGASLAVNPAAGRAQDRPAVRGDIEFVAHRNSDGLIQSIDMVESGRVVRVATFNRDRDYRVTSVSTRTL
jgi:sortase (surface protein transpeptidase)